MNEALEPLPEGNVIRDVPSWSCHPLVGSGMLEVHGGNCVGEVRIWR
jgi:hypothetical protein